MSEKIFRATIEIDGRTGRLASVLPDALDEAEYKEIISALARIMRPRESGWISRLLAGFGRREDTTNFLYQGNLNTGGGR